MLLSKGKQHVKLQDLVPIFNSCSLQSNEQVILEQICYFFFHLNQNYWSGINHKFWKKHEVYSLLLCKEQHSFSQAESIASTFNSLDSDNDGYLEAKDLLNCQCLSHCSLPILQMICTGLGTMEFSPEGKVSFFQFVWLILSLRNLQKPCSMDYFFRIFDSEGTGKITLQQLKSILPSSQTPIKL